MAIRGRFVLGTARVKALGWLKKAPRKMKRKMTNLEVVKIEFRHLPFHLSFFLRQPSALTRAVPRTKRPRIAMKHLEDVPFVLSFLAKQQYQTSFTITLLAEC